MDRVLFITKFKKAKPMTMEEINKILTDSINSSAKDGNPRGHKNLIICMEELSELSKEISKELRGDGDDIGILEELADVQICIYYLQNIIGIGNESLARAVSVKIERLESLLEGDK